MKTECEAHLVFEHKWVVLQTIHQGIVNVLRGLEDHQACSRR